VSVLVVVVFFALNGAEISIIFTFLRGLIFISTFSSNIRGFRTKTLSIRCDTSINLDDFLDRILLLGEPEFSS
jgi:hypothetical protein